MAEKHVGLQRRAFLRSAARAAIAGPFATSLADFCRANAGEPKWMPRAVVAPAAPIAKPVVKVNVRDYGASGDGKTKDTEALQLTIERCSAFGGGEVVVPAGEWLTGAIRFSAA